MTRVLSIHGRLRVERLLSALARFGLPSAIVNMVRGIYASRFFVIKDHTGTSSERRQDSGIAQGCPLSPYLFIIVQTVMMHDMYASLKLRKELEFVETQEVLYADDTVLASGDGATMQKLLNAIVEEGAHYGLELNWAKTHQMQMRRHRVCARDRLPRSNDHL